LAATALASSTLPTAQAGHGVHLAQHPGQAGPNLGQQLFAVVVAEGVIDLLEPVQADHQQRGAGPCPGIGA
jgi:hypothetical protein